MTPPIEIITQFDFLGMARELLFAFGVMAIIFIYLGYFLTLISASHAIKSHIYLQQKSYNLATLEFVQKMTYLALVQMGAVLIWTVAIYSTGLAKNLTNAFLFAGSCYTTIGIFNDVLPPAWRSLALIIAFSGLFAFAWCTSIMMSMTSIFGEIWKQKNETRIRAQFGLPPKHPAEEQSEPKK